MFNMMLNGSPAVADWIVKTVPVVQTIMLIMIVLCSLAIIISVILSPTNSDGGNVITGYNESFYGQNKGFTREGRLKKVIVISAIAIFVLALLYFLSFLLFRGAL